MSITNTQTKRTSESVVEAVASEEGVTPFDLEEALFDAVDPDALDALLRQDTDRRPDVTVEFTFCGYQVTVGGDGEIALAQ